MLAKLRKPRQGLTDLMIIHSQQSRGKASRQLIMTEHNCPCCSDTLLRHMRFGGLYWRCSSCHQEMPI